MIVFKDDWNRYPAAKPDFTTKNKTWLKFAHTLKAMGIANHLFHLSVLDPRVIGLDPHSTELTLEEKGIIAQETKLNIWYSLREVQRVPATAGLEASHFRANKANICMYWMFLNHVTLILVMLRQRGKSLSVDMLTIWLTEFAGHNLKINGSTKDDALRAVNIRRLREIDKELPSWMQKQGRFDSRNLEEFTVMALGNSIRYTLPQKSKKQAEMSGRGSTAQIYLGDEIAYQYNIAISLPAALAAGLAARDNAKLAGSPYGTILTTTAGNRDDRDGAYCYDMMMKSATFSEKMYDAKNQAELSTIIKGTSPIGVERVAATFYQHQLGITDAWMKEAKETLMISGDAELRDLHSIWTHSSGSHPLSSKVIKKIKASGVEPSYIQIDETNGYVINWYIREEEIDSYKDKPLILTLDTSDAVGQDDIAMTFIDPETGRVVAAGSYNRLLINAFSKWIFKLMMTFSRSVAIIERRSTGVAVIDYLISAFVKMNINPFRRLYNTYVQLGEENPKKFEEMEEFDRNVMTSNFYITNKKAFGFATSGSGLTSRTALYSDILTTFANVAGGGIKDRTIIKQLSGLLIINGRVDHTSDGNDDFCISWLLGGFILLKGRNLSYYGINANQVLRVSDAKPLSNKATKFELKQEAIAKEMIALTEEYKRTFDPIRTSILKGRLMLLDRELVTKPDEAFNLDAVLEELDNNKFKKDMLMESSLTTPDRPMLTWTTM